MIEKICIKNIATYDKIVAVNIENLKEINFFYGANGSGKTTISKVIANVSSFSDCSIQWKDNLLLKPYVYNRDFIHQNFNVSNELKGIFTLGKDSVETTKLIDEKKKEEEKIQNEITGLKNNLASKDEEKNKIETEFEGHCWNSKRKYDEIFLQAFDGGIRGSGYAFANRCKKEEPNTATLQTYQYLEEKANKIFHGEAKKFDKIGTFTYDDLKAFEADKILATKIFGKGDIDIAALYKKLGNTDWVKRGKEMLAISEDTCPFCQQKTIDETFKTKLEEYFDETYLTQISKLNTLKDSYEVYVRTKLGSIDKVIAFDNDFVNKTKLEGLKEIIDAKLKANIIQLESKIKEPTLVISLETLIDKFKEFKDEIDNINNQTDAHNKVIDNIANERKILKQEIWRFVVNELQPAFTNYKNKTTIVDKSITGLNSSILTKQGLLNNVKHDLVELTNKITSVQPTVDKINDLLRSFDFNSFSLAEDSVNKGFYKIIRKSGESAKGSLSEGERTFITFLYFYHSLMGSIDSNTITENRIVVFDDPISSLDSSVLFIVSNLIRGLINSVRNKQGTIKQIFILTHNTYFHKEVSFNKSKNKLKDETFWVVKKQNEISKVILQEKNPIKTTYELLWEEAKEKNDTGSLTLHNTLRRILESYFKLLGNENLDDLEKDFEGEEKIIYGSLISWLHSGSHSVSMTDDLFVDTSADTQQKFFKVFKNIFYKKGHRAHYDMMMQEEHL